MSPLPGPVVTCVRPVTLLYTHEPRASACSSAPHPHPPTPSPRHPSLGPQTLPHCCPPGVVPGAPLLVQRLPTVATVPPLTTTSRPVTPKPGSPPRSLLCSRASPQACRHHHFTTLQEPKVHQDASASLLCPLTRNGAHIHAAAVTLVTARSCFTVFLPLHSTNEKPCPPCQLKTFRRTSCSLCSSLRSAHPARLLAPVWY